MLCAKMNMFPGKPVSTIFCAIVYKEMAVIQVFMMRKNQSFVSALADVVFNP